MTQREALSNLHPFIILCAIKISPNRLSSCLERQCITCYRTDSSSTHIYKYQIKAIKPSSHFCKACCTSQDSKHPSSNHSYCYDHCEFPSSTAIRFLILPQKALFLFLFHHLCAMSCYSYDQEQKVNHTWVVHSSP